MAAKLEDLRAHIKSIGLTELYVPSQLVVVEDFPYLALARLVRQNSLNSPYHSLGNKKVITSMRWYEDK